MLSVCLTLYVCMFVSMNHCCCNTQYFPVFTFLCWYAVALSFQHTQTKSPHRAQDMRFILPVFKYFDEAFCTLVMLDRVAQSWAYFFYDWLRRGKEKKREDKWLWIREKVSECLRDSRCRFQMYGNRWQTMQKSKNSFHFSLILQW